MMWEEKTEGLKQASLDLGIDAGVERREVRRYIYI
jgi:hypothetical protein